MVTLISIIITNHNYKDYLSEAVRSVASQQYEHLELITIDDGSDDGSADLIAELQSEYKGRFSRFDTRILEDNRGKQHALNLGLTLVQGEVTIILDADDFLEPDYVTVTTRELIEERSKDPNVAFVYTDSMLVDTNGKPLAMGRSRPFDPELITTLSYIPECGPTWTAELLKLLPLDENIRVGTKHDKWKRLIKIGAKGVYLPRPLFNYRMHTRNLSGIGNRIITELSTNSRSSYILSNFWPLSAAEVQDAYRRSTSSSQSRKGDL